jgi:5-methylcytosine-specific restriction endonuclease McrA
MTRTEFSKSTKLQAWNRCQRSGIPYCECGCEQKIVGRPEYDHKLADGLGGDNSLENCVVMNAKCHRIKTSREDVPMIAKADRLREKAAGIRSKPKWPSRKFNSDIDWNR